MWGLLKTLTCLSEEGDVCPRATIMTFVIIEGRTVEKD